jgi:enoyl-CoA hydratase
MRVKDDPLASLSVGMSVERNYTFTESSVAQFATLIDDHAPFHCDSKFANAAGYPGRIVHGFFVSSIFSGLLGTQLPGENSVINQFAIKFHHAVTVGTCVLYRVSVSQISPVTRAVVLKLAADDSQGQLLLSGTAICCFPTRA